MNLALDCSRQGQWWSPANWGWHIWIQVRTLYSSSPSAVNRSCVHCNYVCLLAEVWIKLGTRQWPSAPHKPMTWLKSPSRVSGNVCRRSVICGWSVANNLGSPLTDFERILMESTPGWTVVNCILTEKWRHPKNKTKGKNEQLHRLWKLAEIK